MTGMLSFARLLALLEVSRTGSISAAAKRLQLTPSAVSHQISTLEREVETRLIERGPRGVWLTVAGTRLAEDSEAVAELMQRAEQEGNVVPCDDLPKSFVLTSEYGFTRVRLTSLNSSTLEKRLK